MLPDTTLVLLLLLICAAHFCVSEVPEEQQRRTAKPADDVALQCCGPTDAPNLLIAWKRPDLKTDKFVFFFRDNGSSITNQHPSFRGRVELIDPEMKDGNVSVILKNVTVNDTGTYECWIGAERTRQEERLDPEVFSTTQLKVDDPGPTAGHTEDGGDMKQRKCPECFIVPAVIVVFLVVMVLIICRKYKVLREKNPNQQVI